MCVLHATYLLHLHRKLSEHNHCCFVIILNFGRIDSSIIILCNQSPSVQIVISRQQLPGIYSNHPPSPGKMIHIQCMYTFTIAMNRLASFGWDGGYVVYYFLLVLKKSICRNYYHSINIRYSIVTAIHMCYSTE